MHFISFEHQGNIKLGALLPDGNAAVELSALGFEREFENMVHYPNCHRKRAERR